MGTGGGRSADTQATGAVLSLPGAAGRALVLSGLWASGVYGLSTVRKPGEVDGMAKYKRYEWPVISQQREKHARPPRHAHVVLRGASACGDCGEKVPWSHLALYGGVCYWCWQAWQVTVRGTVADG